MEESVNSGNLLILRGLEGNEASALGALQRAMEPYSFDLQLLWVIVWLSVLLCVTIKFVILPAIKKYREKL